MRAPSPEFASAAAHVQGMPRRMMQEGTTMGAPPPMAEPGQQRMGPLEAVGTNRSIRFASLRAAEGRCICTCSIIIMLPFLLFVRVLVLFFPQEDLLYFLTLRYCTKYTINTKYQYSRSNNSVCDCLHRKAFSAGVFLFSTTLNVSSRVKKKLLLLA